MYCLDTNIVIDIFRGDEKLREKVNEIGESEDIFISFITLCELYKGAYLSKEAEKSLNEINTFLLYFDSLDLTRDACEIFGKEYSRLQKLGKNTEELDLIIASIAKANNLTLITRDQKHFENINIKKEIW